MPTGLTVAASCHWRTGIIRTKAGAQYALILFGDKCPTKDAEPRMFPCFTGEKLNREPEQLASFLVSRSLRSELTRRDSR